MHAGVVLGSSVVVHGVSTIVIREEILDFPVALLGAHAKFKIFLGDRVPVLRSD